VTANEAQGKAINQAEATAQVQIAVERLAMLHYHCAATLVQELGEEKARDLIAKAIASYGREIGERQRRRVVEAGYEPTCENYEAVPDLPWLAWLPENLPMAKVGDREVPVCPMAKYWIDKGAQELGRQYCYVDQAKFAAYNSDCECRHLKNVLDGDKCCEIVARTRAEWRSDASADEG
jgi:hypothetical protein